jgi:hypothetical protein
MELLGGFELPISWMRSNGAVKSGYAPEVLD